MMIVILMIIIIIVVMILIVILILIIMTIIKVLIMIIIKGGRWGVEVGRKECFCRVREVAIAVRNVERNMERKIVRM